MVSVVLFMASPPLPHPLLWLPWLPDITSPCSEVSVSGWIVFVKMQREVEGYTTVPADSIRRQPQRLVQNRTLRNVFVQCTPGTITLIPLELADRTASRHQDFGDPVEDFDREGHSIFPDMFLPLWHEQRVLCCSFPLAGLVLIKV